MFKLAALFYVIVAPTVMGVLVTAALVTGLDGGLALTVAALLGAALGAPLSWRLAEVLRGKTAA